MKFVAAKRTVRILTPVLAVLVFAACAGVPDRAADPVERDAVSGRTDSVGQRAAAVALEQVGVSYRFGGSSPGGFDCSGLVHYAYLQAGKRVPRTTSQLWDSAEDVRRDRMRAGDILFFRIDGKMSHVGMYIGDGRFVHAPSTGKYVTVESLQSDYYAQALLRAGRLP